MNRHAGTARPGKQDPAVGELDCCVRVLADGLTRNFNQWRIAGGIEGRYGMIDLGTTGLFLGNNFCLLGVYGRVRFNC